MADDDIRRIARDIGMLQGELRALQATVTGVDALSNWHAALDEAGLTVIEGMS